MEMKRAKKLAQQFRPGKSNAVQIRRFSRPEKHSRKLHSYPYFLRLDFGLPFLFLFLVWTGAIYFPTNVTCKQGPRTNILLVAPSFSIIKAGFFLLSRCGKLRDVSKRICFSRLDFKLHFCICLPRISELKAGMFARSRKIFNVYGNKKEGFILTYDFSSYLKTLSGFKEAEF